MKAVSDHIARLSIGRAHTTAEMHYHILPLESMCAVVVMCVCAFVGECMFGWVCVYMGVWVFGCMYRAHTTAEMHYHILPLESMCAVVVMCVCVYVCASVGGCMFGCVCVYGCMGVWVYVYTSVAPAPRRRCTITSSLSKVCVRW